MRTSKMPRGDEDSGRKAIGNLGLGIGFKHA